MSKAAKLADRMRLAKDFARQNVAVGTALIVAFAVALFAMPRVEANVPDDLSRGGRIRMLVSILNAPLCLFSGPCSLATFTGPIATPGGR